MIVFGKENPKGIFSFGVFLFAVPFGKRFFVRAYGVATVENFRRSWDFSYFSVFTVPFRYGIMYASY